MPNPVAAIEAALEPTFGLRAHKQTVATLNDLSDIPVRVINLDRTPERLASFRVNNPHIVFERFRACPGAAKPREAWIEEGLIAPGNDYHPGAIGCGMSHVTLWRDCVAAALPCHIMEDDVVLRRDFREMADRILNRLAAWDIVAWTWNFDWPLRFRPANGLNVATLQLDPYAIKTLYAEFQDCRTSPLMAPLISGSGTACYSISPAGAAKLLRALLPFGDQGLTIGAGNYAIEWSNTGLDVEMSKAFPTMRAFVAIPPLATSINDLSLSTIRGAGRDPD
jgi:GR25 family glycosyltransferase involved in LPS biosynthesis